MNNNTPLSERSIYWLKTLASRIRPYKTMEKSPIQKATDANELVQMAKEVLALVDSPAPPPTTPPTEETWAAEYYKTQYKYHYLMELKVEQANELEATRAQLDEAVSILQQFKRLDDLKDIEGINSFAHLAETNRAMSDLELFLARVGKKARK